MTAENNGPSNVPGIWMSEWDTPGGHTATMQYRGGTSDWNTISACLRNPMGENGDEYHLPSGLTGWALDLGAHVGAVTVGLLLDNPELHVLAIEAVPPNVEMIEANLAINGVQDRAIVWNAAAWNKPGEMTVEYDYSGNEIAEVHRYIGSVSPWISDVPRTYAKVRAVTLKDALAVTEGQGFVWVKSDCEGCEHPFFRGVGLRKLGTIEGEWHERDGTPESFAATLSKTHEVTWDQGIGGGPFKAVRR
jgi:FkbM family methyltransferase